MIILIPLVISGIYYNYLFLFCQVLFYCKNQEKTAFGKVNNEAFVNIEQFYKSLVNFNQEMHDISKCGGPKLSLSKNL